MLSVMVPRHAGSRPATYAVTLVENVVVRSERKWNTSRAEVDAVALIYLAMSTSPVYRLSVPCGLSMR